MTKEQFIKKLNTELSFLSSEELENRLAFYCEMIDDRMEEGLSEDEAVAEIGNIEEIIAQLKKESFTCKIISDKDDICPDETDEVADSEVTVPPKKKKLSAWAIVLISGGSPLWITLGAAAFVIIVAAYAVIWSVAGSLWSLPVSLAAACLGAIAVGVVTIVCGNALAGIALIGMAIACAGLSIFAGIGCFHLTRLAVFISKAIARFIKSLFIGKERSHA